MSEEHFDFEKMNDQISTLSGLAETRLATDEAYHKQIGNWEMYLENTPLPDFANEKLRVYIETLKKAYADVTEFIDAMEAFISGLDAGKT